MASLTCFKASGVPVEFVKVHHEPDGNFPHGIPNPILQECRTATAEAAIEHKADMGIAWDGDFDRCFLFDEVGEFIEGYYIVGLLGEGFLAHTPGAKIIHDPRPTTHDPRPTADLEYHRPGDCRRGGTGAV